jgi:outer membrane protein, protease secretion system
VAWWLFRRLLPLIVLAVESNLAFGAENLLSLYREALTTNAPLLAAQAGAVAEQENENIARGQLLPNLSLGGSYSGNRTERQIAAEPSQNFNYQSYAYNLNLRQPVFRKYNWALYEQSKAQGEAAGQQLNSAGNEMAIRLVGAYLELLFSEDQLRLLAAQKLAVAGQMQAAEKGVIAGSGTRIDVDEARARYDMILAQELEAQNLQMHQRRTLGAMVNRQIGDIAALNGEQFKLAPPTPGDVNSWLKSAEENNTDFQAVLFQVMAAEQEVEKALAGHYPTIDLVAGAGRSSNDNLSTLNRFGDTDYSTLSYGVQVNIPLFAGGQVSATVRQAKAKLEQNRQKAEEIRRNIGVQTQREFDNVVQGIAKIRALERAEISGRQTVVSTKKGIEGGVRSTLDVLQVEQQYFIVLRDLALARYTYLIAGLKLKGLAGVLSDNDIAGLSLELSGHR